MIAGTLDLVAQKPDPDRIKEVSNTAREAITLLRQTIWTLNKDVVSVESFSDRFKSYALKQVEVQEGLRIVFEEDIVVNHQLPPQDALHLFRICQEALHNTLKYAQATLITCHISTAKGTRFHIKITDNGIGFDPAVPHDESFGLDNMQSRAAEIGAQCHVSSQPGTGTTVEVTLA
jgi:signal transduction histidine kinase